MREETIRLIRQHKVISIVRNLPFESLAPFANAVLYGGGRLVEVTFMQDDPRSWERTCESIRLLNGMGICAGAGTVLTERQLTLAHDAGARYIISPNTDEKVIRRTRELGLVSIPGAFTPTEISGAYQFGADFVKLFPVSALGPAYIKAIRAPLCHIPLIAVGGISSANMHEYIAAGCAAVGVGGNLANLSLIRSGAFDRIEQLARSYADAESPPHP